MKKLEYNYVKQQFENEGYKLLSEEYIGAHSKLSVECQEGHQYKVSYHDVQQGCRCPICANNKKHNYEYDRTQIINPKTRYNLELDIYIPSLNKAVEFNGEYWHDNNYSKYKDDQKLKQCKEKNIDLLTIWYQDWIDNREEQINNLKEFLK